MKSKMLRAFSFFISLFVVSSSSLAADTNPPPRLTVELRDGSRVVGASTAGELKFTSPLFGKVRLAVPDIRTVEFVASNSVKLKAANGDALVLQPLDSTLELKTSFGKVELATGSIRKISVSTSAVSVPQREGLIGFWAGNGNSTDSIGTNNASLAGRASYTDGLTGQAFNFDASGSFVKIPQADELNPASQITVAFWMKAATDNAMQNYQGLVTSDFYGVEISNGYGGNMGVNFFISTTDNQPSRPYSRYPDQFIASGLRSRITSVGNFVHTSDVNGGGAPVSAGQWHHIAATYDGRQMRLYVDGQMCGSPRPQTGQIAPMLPASFVAIGSEDGRTTCPDCYGSRYFKGAISHVAIYQRALSQEEIRADYASQKTD